MAKAKRPSGQSDEDILDEARTRFRQAVEADADNRVAALDDVKFAFDINGYQWDGQAKKLRKGRPCLTENRLPQFIRQVVNAQRRNRPAMEVIPANSEAAPGTAKIVGGMIRSIEQASRADLAYDNAFEGAVSGSVGYFRINTKYVDDSGFDQDIVYEPIDNPFSVYDDPSFKMPDGSDRKWCFVTEFVSADDFEAEYGEKPTDIDDCGLGDDIDLWYKDGEVRVAEYWRVRQEETTLKAGKRSRTVRRPVVEQFLMTGDKIIRETAWLGIMLPIIPVYGETKNIEGRKWRKSLVRDAKTLQKINNFWLSAETEAVALQPKAPWIGPEGAFQADKKKWATSNSENHAYLQYSGEIAPQRVEPPAFPAAMRETRMGAIEGMKAVMGIYDASLGARSNETSGVAIEARQEQGSDATYHYIDNMARAMRYAGACIIDLLPKIYDAPRAARIIAPDGQADMVAIQGAFPPGPDDAPMINPKTMQRMQPVPLIGRYDLVVKAGPSFETQRQQNVEMINELIKAYPPLMQAAGDLLVKNMDFPEAAEIAARLAPQGGPNPQAFAAMQQQIPQMQQALQQLHGQNQQLQQTVNEQKLAMMKKDIELVAAKAQVKDNTMGVAADVHATNEETRRFLIEKLFQMEQMSLAAKQPVATTVEQTRAAEPAVASLIGQ